MREKVGWILGLAGCVAVFAAIWPRATTTPDERKALAENRAIVIYWDRHQGHEHEMRRTLIDEFNRSQNEVYVRALPIGFNASMEKLLTAVAGSSPPDICSLDATIMIQLVGQGCFTPLEGFMKDIPGLREEDFMPHCWSQVNYGGHVWGIPTTTDSFCLLWNKAAFRKAGLDPERPPQTMEELAEYAAKLTVRSDKGIEQVGFFPWAPWDQTHMWGLVFNGTWYDPAKDAVVCAADPNIKRMFEWQRSFAIDPASNRNPSYAIDPQQFQNFQSLGSYMSTSNPFYTGKVAMIAEGEWQVTFIPKYAPELDWGVAPLPMPSGAPLMSYGAPSVVDCIPRGCKNPQAAWKFLRWFHTKRPNGDTSASSDYCYAIHNVPPRLADARQDRFYGDPKFKVFIQVLLERNVRMMPRSPVAQFLMDELDRQRERIIFRETEIEPALEQIQEKVNAEIADVNKLVARAQDEVPVPATGGAAQ